jgi:hypothetical protein
VIATLCVGALAVIPSSAATSARVVLIVKPVEALTDAPVEIRVSGLNAYEAVVLEATTKDARGKT